MGQWIRAPAVVTDMVCGANALVWVDCLWFSALPELNGTNIYLSNLLHH